MGFRLVLGGYFIGLLSAYYAIFIVILKKKDKCILKSIIQTSSFFLILTLTAKIF